MKAVTEFASFTLNQAMKAKAALSAEGKTPEEIQANLGQTFKCEGDKLTHLINAIDVVGESTEGLKRVMVMSASEGEKLPPKAKQVGDHVYIPEMHIVLKPQAAGADKRGKGGGRGGRDAGKKGKGKEKEGKWGLSPEELAAKKKAPPAKSPA